MIWYVFFFLESINTVVLEQDDPCIVNILRTQYLHPPSKEKLSLEKPEDINPSMGQAQSVLEILKNKVVVNFLFLKYCWQ